MVLESASTMNNTNIILLHRPDIGADPNVSLIDIGERNVAKTIMLDGGVNLTEAVSSRDGTAITVSFSNGTSSTFALNSDRTGWIEISMQGVPYDDSPFSRYGSAISISDGARHVAASEPGVVQTYSTNKPVCGPDEVTIRLAINFDGNPERVGWSVFFQAGEERGKTYASYDTRYAWLRQFYSWSAISTDICVPRTDLSCVGLTVEVTYNGIDQDGNPVGMQGFPQDINGFAAYVVDDGQVTLVASDSGRTVDGSKVYSFENATVEGRCDSTNFPSQSPSLSSAPTVTCVDDGTCREGCVFENTWVADFYFISSSDSCRSECSTVNGTKAFTFQADFTYCNCWANFCNPTFDYDVGFYGRNITSGPV